MSDAPFLSRINQPPGARLVRLADVYRPGRRKPTREERRQQNAQAVKRYRAKLRKTA